MKKKRIEERVASTILQREIEMKIGAVTYAVKQPSVATLILASEEIAKLPTFDLSNTDKQIVIKTLNVAKDCQQLGRILATIIVGAKDINKVVEIRRKFFGLKKEKVLLVDQVADEVLENTTPFELQTAMNKLFESMQIGFFFGIITSLNEINLLKPTQTIVSGQ